MNASRLSATPTAPVSPPREVAKTARAGRSLIFSLTGVCFVFGGLLAMQLRAIQQVNNNRVREKEGIAVANEMAVRFKNEAAAANADRVKANVELARLRDLLAKGGSLSASQIAALNTQIKDLQMVSGLTSITGPGMRITLSDNPNAAKTGGDTAFLPGLVHDYDILQVVNELRSAKADAIAVKGAGGEAIRVTGYTPIRCVGPAILVNWEPVAAPFTVEAVGDTATMKSALTMPNGIIDQLKNNGAIGVKISVMDSVTLPASSNGVPRLRVAKATP